MELKALSHYDGDTDIRFWDYICLGEDEILYTDIEIEYIFTMIY